MAFFILLSAVIALLGSELREIVVHHITSNETADTAHADLAVGASKRTRRKTNRHIVKIKLNCCIASTR